MTNYDVINILHCHQNIGHQVPGTHHQVPGTRHSSGHQALGPRSQVQVQGTQGTVPGALMLSSCCHYDEAP